MKRHNQRRRQGMAIVYIVVSVTALLGFCSLAVDLGRVVVAKTQLRIAADAAARAGVAALPQGSSAVATAAAAAAAQNQADGYAVTLNTSTDVKVGVWNSTTHSFSSSGTANNTTTYQAVQVTARRTAATSTAVPLLFAGILGFHNCDVTATSVGALVVVQQPATQYVSSHGNPWLAGEPKGKHGSVPDGGYSSSLHPWEYDDAYPGKDDTSSTTYTDSSKVEYSDYESGQPYGSPTEYSLTVTPGAVLQISVPLNSSNEVNNQGYNGGGYTANTYANGDSGGSYSSYADDAASYYGAGVNPNGYSPPSGYTVSPENVGAGNANSAANAQGSEHGLSNIYTPINSMVGVFLNSNDSTNGADSESSVPPGLDFSSQTARDYTTIDPQLQQTFYVGNGSTSTSSIQQTIVVPSGATNLFLGTMDGHEWSNNLGGFNATITEYQIAIVQ
jgi:Flp pilus assembly protein TadG